MNETEKLLIAIGSSVTANCQSCLETAIYNATLAGASKEDVLEALDIGRLIRRGAMNRIDQHITKIMDKDYSKPDLECSCFSMESTDKEMVKQDDQEKCC